LRSVGSRALRNVIEGKLIPLLLFLGFLSLIGSTGAVLAALAWSLACIAVRMASGRRVPGLVILTAAGLGARTIAAIASGSMVVYFLQPTISTALVGAVFLCSVFVDRPLAEKLAHDFCPFEDSTARHPVLRQYFARLSLLWSVTSMINAALTLWLLLTQPVTTFVVVKSFLGPGFTAVTIGVSVVWFRFTMRRSGLRIVFASSPRRPRVESGLAFE
jgi:hypothetical protein